ncbi:MAG TPA: response regulator [Fimbriimonas sp.]|nr:response regulator [Fimbriimonas sp.]
MRTAVGSAQPQVQRILVCDDERHITRSMRTNLERLGHTVVCVNDGDEAVRLLESLDKGPGQSVFDRIILDEMMPNMNGFEVLKWIRQHEHTRHIWVALMIPTAQDREVYGRAPYKADAYLIKPFDATDVLK